MVKIKGKAKVKQTIKNLLLLEAIDMDNGNMALLESVNLECAIVKLEVDYGFEYVSAEELIILENEQAKGAIMNRLERNKDSYLSRFSGKAKTFFNRVWRVLKVLATASLAVGGVAALTGNLGSLIGLLRKGASAAAERMKFTDLEKQFKEVSKLRQHHQGEGASRLQKAAANLMKGARSAADKIADAAKSSDSVVKGMWSKMAAAVGLSRKGDDAPTATGPRATAPTSTSIRKDTTLEPNVFAQNTAKVGELVNDLNTNANKELVEISSTLKNAVNVEDIPEEIKRNLLKTANHAEQLRHRQPMNSSTMGQRALK